ncbi:MAG: class I SAM-dependent methyltransferase [Frankia sp.]
MRRAAEKFEVVFTPEDPLLESLVQESRGLLLDRALDDFVSDVIALDQSVGNGSDRPPIAESIDGAEPIRTDDSLIVSGQQVMQEWESPLMRTLADLVTRPGGSVLEIGFGLGISAGFVQEIGPRRHTIVEANPQIFEMAVEWRRANGYDNVELVGGRWEDALTGLGQYDGILFDTYPLTEAEIEANVRHAPVYAGQFFAAAARHLAAGGSFTYFTGEIDSLSRRHQRSLLDHFASFSVRVVDGLQPPADCSYWWAASMAVVVASNPRPSVDAPP